MGHLLVCVDIESHNITFQDMYVFKLCMAEKCVNYILSDCNHSRSDSTMNGEEIVSRFTDKDDDDTLSSYLHVLSLHFDLVKKIGLLGMYELFYNVNTFDCETSKTILSFIKLFSKNITNQEHLNSIKPFQDIFKQSVRHKKNVLIL